MMGVGLAEPLQPAVRGRRAQWVFRFAEADHGQALVEFALVVPVLMLILVGIFQFGKTYNDWIRLTDAVRVSGRAAATQLPDPGGGVTRACNAGLTAWQLDPSFYNCGPTPTVNGDPAVTITGTSPFRIDIFGLPVFSGNLTSTSTERLT